MIDLQCLLRFGALVCNNECLVQLSPQLNYNQSKALLLFKLGQQNIKAVRVPGE